LSIEAKFGSLKEMEKANLKFEKFVEKLTPSSSSLFIGLNEENSGKYLESAAKLLGVKKFDICTLVPEIKSGKNKSIFVSSVRSWIHDMNITPSGSFKIGAVLGAEKLNTEAANTLLKILEEPPRYAYIFIFSATDNMLATVKSRCKQFHFSASKDTSVVEQFDREILTKYFYEQSREIEKKIKDNEINEFLDMVLQSAEQDLRNDPTLKNSALLKEIYKVKRRIKQNANARLQVENLLLKFKNH